MTSFCVFFPFTPYSLLPIFLPFVSIFLSHVSVPQWRLDERFVRMRIMDDTLGLIRLNDFLLFCLVFRLVLYACMPDPAGRDPIKTLLIRN